MKQFFVEWRGSLKVFGSGEGALLRNHREIIAAAWTDFEARLPDRYPPMLSALLAFEDGRELGLKYPNLLHSDSGEIIPHAESSFLEVS